MKRMINANQTIEAWNVGEPSNFPEGPGKRHSYWDKPKDWKEKTQIVDDAVIGHYNVTGGGRSPWGITFRSPDGAEFRFDLWEDEESIDEQLERFDEWAYGRG